MKMKEEIKLKKVFGERRVVGLAGEKSSGKTNNLMDLIKEFRDKNKTTPICVYGLDVVTLEWVKKLGNVTEVNSVEQMSNKKDNLIIIDEFQRLNLNDRRYRQVLNQFVDFIYHRNNWVILSSPSLREFNSVIGGKIERWAIKSIKLSELINGSQLKQKVIDYKGRFKSINDIRMPKDTLLVLDDEEEVILKLNYIKEIDTKRFHKDIF